MNNATKTDGGGPNGPDLSRVREAVDAAVDLARDYDDKFQERIFETALDHALGAPPSRITPAQEAAARLDDQPPPPDKSGGLEGLAREAGIPPDALRRHVSVEDGEVMLHGEVHGSSRSERQNNTSAAYLLLKEWLVDEQDAHLEELKEVCEKQRDTLDSNFTRNLRNGDYVLEKKGKTGSTNKRYSLSHRGVEAAKEVLRQVAGVGDES